MRRNETQVKFLEAISAFPGIQLHDLRYMIDRKATVEADRFVLINLQRKHFIEVSGDSIYNQTFTCTESGQEFLHGNSDLLKPKQTSVELEDDEERIPGTCQQCSKPTKDLIRFRKKDICPDCLNGDWVPTIIPTYLSSFVIAD